VERKSRWLAARIPGDVVPGSTANIGGNSPRRTLNSREMGAQEDFQSKQRKKKGETEVPWGPPDVMHSMSAHSIQRKY